MVSQIHPEVFQLRETLVCSYLLRHGDEVCLIDSGFARGIKNIEDCLSLLKLGFENITTALLTHGHLDHTRNLAEIKRRSNATIYAHPLDAAHISGRYPYRGISRMCGLLEASGRILFGYSPPSVDLDLYDSQTIPFGGGIRVIHTPGHTLGHCCFHWEKHDILFCGDLFATGQRRTFLPPAFLISCPEHFPQSLQRVLQLDPAGILSNHCNNADAKLQKQRFVKLATR